MIATLIISDILADNRTYSRGMNLARCNTTMATISAKVKNVRVFESEESASVQITLDKEFEGFVMNDGTATKQNITAFSMNRSALTAQLCDINDDIALYRACQSNSLTQKQLALILFGATITIERELRSAGETYTSFSGEERAFEHDCYTTKIVKLALSDKALRMLDAACTL